MKFGGTSVGSPEALRSVARIVAEAARARRVVVVASAASGVTDRLVRALEEPEARAGLARDLAERYLSLAENVLGADPLASYARVVGHLLTGIDRLVRQIGEGAAAPAQRDALLASGERLSVPLVARVLRAAGVRAEATDAAAFVLTRGAPSDPRADLELTRRRARSWHARFTEQHGECTVPVVTGFVGADASGTTTTLGRGGSDLTAALLAYSLRACAMERWTDTDGLYTADPRTDPTARRLEHIVLADANVLNHAGRLGMHPDALDPLVRGRIPAHIRSTRNPGGAGTRIVPAGRAAVRCAA